MLMYSNVRCKIVVVLALRHKTVDLRIDTGSWDGIGVSVCMYLLFYTTQINI